MSKGKCEGKVKEKIHEVREGKGESKGERKVRERLPELVFNENPLGEEQFYQLKCLQPYRGT